MCNKLSRRSLQRKVQTVMSIYVTGDLHGSIDFSKLLNNKLQPEDYLIICGDAAIIWGSSHENDIFIKKLMRHVSCNILYVDGNHENFDMLNAFPVEIWNGGKVHRINNRILHLMRGQLFNIGGETIFTFGGAISHDKEGRIIHKSWWPEEEPSYSEFNEGYNNLEASGWKVDYIITHCLPDSIQGIIASWYKHSKTTNMLETFACYTRFKTWYCGHYHIDRLIKDKYQILYDKIVKLGDTYDR